MADGNGFDLDKFTRIVGRLGTPYEGERTNALALGSRMLEAAGMRWEDFIGAYRKAEIATAAAADLLAQNAELKDEIDRLRAENGASTALAVWQDAGPTITDTRRAAEWLLDLCQGQIVYLTPKETDFLHSVIRWVGPLRPKQQAFLRSIVDQTVRRTGRLPPSP